MRIWEAETPGEGGLFWLASSFALMGSPGNILERSSMVR